MKSLKSSGSNPYGSAVLVLQGDMDDPEVDLGLDTSRPGSNTVTFGDPQRCGSTVAGGASAGGGGERRWKSLRTHRGDQGVLQGPRRGGEASPPLRGCGAGTVPPPRDRVPLSRRVPSRRRSSFCAPFGRGGAPGAPVRPRLPPPGRGRSPAFPGPSSSSPRRTGPRSAPGSGRSRSASGPPSSPSGGTPPGQPAGSPS